MFIYRYRKLLYTSGWIIATLIIKTQYISNAKTLVPSFSRERNIKHRSFPVHARPDSFKYLNSMHRIVRVITQDGDVTDTKSERVD